MTALTESVLKCKTLNAFIELMQEHEALLCHHLSLDSICDQRGFGDFNGAIKSLGAWGGDFILAASSDSESEVKAYFKAKGYETVIPYQEMILQNKEAEVA